MNEPLYVYDHDRSEVPEERYRPATRSEIIEALGIDYAAARCTFDELYYGNPTELGLVLDKTIAAALGLGDDE